MIRAVLFDLDETLLDRTGSLLAFLKSQHARFRTLLGKAALEEWQAQFQALDQRGLVSKKDVYPALLSVFGGDPSAAADLVTDYQSNCCRYARAFPGAVDGLVALHNHGLALGIVTNGEADFQAKHIEALGLSRLVDSVLISAIEGLRKPDPAIFRRAADRVKCAPEECLFVGDNPSADVLGAQAAGMRAIWFRGGREWPSDLPAWSGDAVDDHDKLLRVVLREVSKQG